MKRVIFIFSLLFVLTVLSTPLSVEAVDKTGGTCACTVTIHPIAVDPDGHPYPDSSEVVSLGTQYDYTTDASSCATACTTYAADREGFGLSNRVRVTGSDYLTPSEAESHAAAQATAEKTAASYLKPSLTVSIPGLTFSDILNENGILHINFLPEYLNGIYRYALGAGALIAVVMIMIGGAQYILGSGMGSVEAGKKRITNAVTGLVLLLSAYALLYIVNPSLTIFSSVDVSLVDQIRADLDTAGADEGTSAGSNATTCEAAIADATSAGKCPLKQELISPTSATDDPADDVSCNYHFTENSVNYDYTQMTRGLDFKGTWGDSLYAAGAGTLELNKGSATSHCGNNIAINLDGGGRFTVCHVKGFNTAIKTGAHVNRGDLIGYIGGRCCSGQTPPADWPAYKGGWCKFTGTTCGSPFTGNATCDCQTYDASGNTTGPHAHGSLSLNGVGIPLLTCLAATSSTDATATSDAGCSPYETDSVTGEELCAQ